MAEQQQKTNLATALACGQLAQHHDSIEIITPKYTSTQLKPRIVHLGFGAFHRAHQAIYTHELAQLGQSDWGICSVNLFANEQLVKTLNAQANLFSVIEKGAESTQCHIVGSVINALHPKIHSINTVIEQLAHPDTAIVSLTITEKGYCLNMATGRLDFTNPLIQQDLVNLAQPQSAIGYIVSALSLRKARNLTGFSVLSCDNLQGNGHKAKAAVMDFAKHLSEDLAKWIEQNVIFPLTMVDRIVPAVTEETKADVAQLLGVEDLCGVVTEPFKQWIIEDNFVAGRPDWHLVGAEFVKDVEPYEEMKLRMLNGSHSMLAYLGNLAGYEHIADAMQDTNFYAATRKMMLVDQAPTLNMPSGTDLTAYAQALLDRFSNPNLKHRTAQIAMDGSQKIPQRLAASLQFHLHHHSDFTWIAAAIAGWMRYVAGVNEQGETFEVKDPLASYFIEVNQQDGLSVNRVKTLLSNRAIFPAEIANHPKVITSITAIYAALLNDGAKQTVARLVANQIDLN